MAEVSPQPSSEAKPTSSRPRSSGSWLRNLSRSNLALLVLLYVTSLHLVGLYTFTQGFLLTRVAIPTVSPAYSVDEPAPIPARYKKAVILVIDALRTDFISPHYPSPKSPHHHDVLTLPAELSASQPDHSIIFNTYSDPPTSTMQRLKGITTGSLPTFIDVSSNFASTAVEEDSLISQLVQANKTIGFMGDDTWINLFPDSFTLSHPYDSFNVEDLHSVDEGVIEHLFPYLHPENQTRWDVLIGHFLGVDHVGHRVGPNRDTMKTKLEQMDKVLRQVVEAIDEETLLVVLGDHGMDDKGNHGGDSDLETAAALWLYSKGSPLTTAARQPAGILPTYIFPRSETPLRHINQIDIVPTLALLLGIPIPYNNLGAVIPECFAIPDQQQSILELATRLNAEQIDRYIHSYGDKAVLRGLAGPLAKVKSAAEATQAEGAESAQSEDGATARGKVSDWIKKHSHSGHQHDGANSSDNSQVLQQSINAHRHFTLEALRHLRALWAQFSVPLIFVGSLILGLSVLTLIALYIGVRNNGAKWDVYARLALETAAMASGVIASVVGTVAGIYTAKPLVAIKTFIVVSAIVSEIVLIAPLFVQSRISLLSSFSINRAIGPLLLFAHSISFASNSFVMWEDRLVLFLITTVPVIYFIKALSAPTANMRLKIIFLSIAYAILVRLIATVTICREEQQPYCRVTFYSGNTPTAPAWALVAIIPLALQLPRAIGLTLTRSKSLGGPAPFFLGMLWRGVLVANAVYWVLEWLESHHNLNPDRIPLVKLLKLWIARTSVGVTIGAMPYVWLTSPLCISVERTTDQTNGKEDVTVFGFANAFGSTYILFLLVPFALIHLVSLPMAQLTLSGMLVALLVYLELVDTRRDAIALTQSFASQASTTAGFDMDGSGPDFSLTIVRPTFTDIVPIALGGFVTFFATGHQAVLSSIQWKSAFIGFDTVTYPFSPLLVILNTCGPFFLSAITIPLMALWNISPRPRSTIPTLAHSLQLSLAFLIYHTTVVFASAITAAWLRRHLMVWKVFAPRFMLSGVTLLVVDVGVLIAIGVGVRVTGWKIKRTFGCESV
ncbi:hypothetical protein CI109_101101 [Kwoniella shandongensis]|uniref:GPI ethanolamine phosphate transferase 2 C-terminal domain-containing protein n=1 Tax=Kwoniella shandongensis TaxID=1734106 RepID=A0A5M6C589_9TREE|nr:uncharacterized protein CI109_001569 [Kwoniella shandongensis]KAA5530163.1 hypothetical protein CI109_001569 [Kwoniella shandongensis]